MAIYGLRRQVDDVRETSLPAMGCTPRRLAAFTYVN